MEDKPSRERLTAEVQRTAWHPLRTHHERDAVWMVDTELDLVTAAMGVVEDQVDAVGYWIQSGRMRKPTDPEVAAWEMDAEAERFVFVIVQPFVLVKEQEVETSVQ